MCDILKVRTYIEQQFIPWILFLDNDDTIRHFKEGKEGYLCETYNHISSEFKSLDHYELYMFRVSFTKAMTQFGMMNFIICNLPPVINIKESSMIVLVYNEYQLNYYYLEYMMENTFSLSKIDNDKQKSLVKTMLNPTAEEVINTIKSDLI